MRVLQQLAEQRLAEAEARGELSNLPGSGAPLCLDDDALVPEELRAAYRILRNAGYVPAPVRCAAELAQMLETEGGDDDARTRAVRNRRMTMLSVQLGERFAALQNQAYRQQLLAKLATSPGARPARTQSDDEPEPPSVGRGE